MTGQHAHTRIHAAHKRKPLVYCNIIIDGTGMKSPEEYEHKVRHHLCRITKAARARRCFASLKDARTTG